VTGTWCFNNAVSPLLVIQRWISGVSKRWNRSDIHYLIKRRHNYVSPLFQSKSLELGSAVKMCIFAGSDIKYSNGIPTSRFRTVFLFMFVIWGNLKFRGRHTLQRHFVRTNLNEKQLCLNTSVGLMCKHARAHSRLHWHYKLNFIRSKRKLNDSGKRNRTG
jgi:hypothetical protein